MEHLWIAFMMALGIASSNNAAAQQQDRIAQAPPVDKSAKDRPGGAAAESEKARKGKAAGKDDDGKIDRDARRFMERAARAGQAEVQAGKLAEKNASSGEVKKFARQMVEDHTKANQELQALASKKGVKLPAEPDRNHADRIKKLSELSGADFDRRYMNEFGVDDHRRTVKQFRDAQKEVKDADVKAYIDKHLPTVEKHQEMARTVYGSVKGQGDEKKSERARDKAKSDTAKDAPRTERKSTEK